MRGMSGRRNERRSNDSSRPMNCALCVLKNAYWRLEAVDSIAKFRNYPAAPVQHCRAPSPLAMTARSYCGRGEESPP